MGSMLLTHISPLNARKYGVNVQADAVLDGKHTFVLIVDAENKSQVENFMQPFQMAGSIEITPASSCEVVVERAGCQLISYATMFSSYIWKYNEVLLKTVGDRII